MGICIAVEETTRSPSPSPLAFSKHINLHAVLEVKNLDNLTTRCSILLLLRALNQDISKMIAIYPLHPLLTSMSTTPWTSALILTITTYLAYELYTFLRLRHIPGPAFASSITKQWMIRKALKGRFHLDLKALSDQYGPLVRIGPDELLSTDPQILRRMSAARSSYTKGKSYESAQLKQGVDNLVAMRDEKAHKELRERTKPAVSISNPISILSIPLAIEQIYVVCVCVCMCACMVFDASHC